MSMDVACPGSAGSHALTSFASEAKLEDAEEALALAKAEALS